MRQKEIMEQMEEVLEVMPAKRQIKEIPEMFAYWAAVKSRPNNYPIVRDLSDAEVVAWVDLNTARIHRKIESFVDRSDCTIEDFEQEAYLQALTARNIAARKRLPLEGCFWVCFHKLCCNKVKERKKRLQAEQDALRQPARHYLSPVLTAKVLPIMTEAQQLVWRHLLETRSVKEIARVQGVTHQTVQRVRDQGMKRVSKYFSKHPELLAA